MEPVRPLPPPPGRLPGPPPAVAASSAPRTTARSVLTGYRAAFPLTARRRTINVAVTGDPDIKITDADRKVWFDTAMDLQQLQQKANDAAELVQNANAQLQQLQQQTRNQTLAPAVKQSLDSLNKEMESGAARLGLMGGGGGFCGNPENVRGRIGQLKGAVIGSTAVPTNTQLQQIREAKAALRSSSTRRTRSRRSCRRS